MPSTVEINRAARRRVRVLELIRKSVRDRGYPPTLTELAAATKVSKRTSAVDLERLVEAGAIRRTPTARGIELVS